MRCSSYFCILLLFIVMIFSCVISSERWSKCNTDSTYTDGSTFSENLNRVMNDLFRNTPQSSGFNTSYFGQTPNKVYGLLQCIANVSTEKCSECAQDAYYALKRDCANGIGGLVLMDDCLLRYDNSDFISTLDDSIYHYLCNGKNISGNMDDFKAATSSLLSNLSNVVYDSANKRYGIGSANYSTSQYVYGLAQCWRDLTIEDCQTCLVNVRSVVEKYCSGRQGGQAVSKSCTVRFEKNPFFDTTAASAPTPTISTPTPAISPPPRKDKSSKTLPIILVVMGGLILSLVICLTAMRSKRVRFAIFGKRVPNEELDAYSPVTGLLLPGQQNFVMSLKELTEATQDFDENNKLGQGGFGSVYRGTTGDGKEIAVKKLSAKSTQSKVDFMNEVKLMANVQHRNLVKLLGCCAEGDERLIVLEYFPNKSLDTFLFDPEKRKQLDWQKCYNIINGIVRGLLYLHEDSHMRIIHRDIKANNILLDDKFNPKIADFGLARLFDEDETQIQTRAAGTYGYMAPEYAMRGQLSVKADVYSFGVLLLEIVSGRKNTDFNLPHEMQNLLEWAWRLYRGGNVTSMVESRVKESWPQERVERCIHVALLCVQADATVRPAMSNIITMIASNAVALPNPTKPASAFSSSSSGSGIPSVNDTSITDGGPR